MVYPTRLSGVLFALLIATERHVLERIPQVASTGINTSDSTVAAGGSAGGGTVGTDTPTDRSRVLEREFTQYSQHMINRMSGGQMSGQTASTPQTTPGDQVAVETQNAPQEQGKKGSRPCLPKKPKKSTKTPKWPQTLPMLETSHAKKL